MQSLSALVDGYIAGRRTRPQWTVRDLGSSIHISGIPSVEEAERVAEYLRKHGLMATVARLDHSNWGIVARSTRADRGRSPSASGR